uniref:Uncharacterized protein n=1 Tax=virus sp. ctBM815 TaxID=2825806 RepID=A0A8S5RJF2_9VIRU|nr:MAG TPA: hypothetical protein [virus sp. ctBM815]
MSSTSYNLISNTSSRKVFNLKLYTKVTYNKLVSSTINQSVRCKDIELRICYIRCSNISYPLSRRSLSVLIVQNNAVSVQFVASKRL